MNCWSCSRWVWAWTTRPTTARTTSKRRPGPSPAGPLPTPYLAIPTAAMSPTSSTTVTTMTTMKRPSWVRPATSMVKTSSISSPSSLPRRASWPGTFITSSSPTKQRYRPGSAPRPRTLKQSRCWRMSTSAPDMTFAQCCGYSSTPISSRTPDLRRSRVPPRW